VNYSYIYHIIGEIMMQLCVYSSLPVRHGTSPVSPVEYLLLILIKRIGQHYSTVSWVPCAEIRAESLLQFEVSTKLCHGDHHGYQLLLRVIPITCM